MILRVSRREQYLQAILDQVRRLAKNTGARAHVLMSFDRPSPRVALTLEGIRNYHSRPGMKVYIRPAPAPILSAQGERWMQVLQGQYTDLLGLAPIQACMLWDDDALFPEPALRELVEQFRDLPDRVEARSLFAWDDRTQHNVMFPEHWSTVLFRVYPGDAFPEDYVVHCPEGVARSKSCVRMSAPVMNYGYLTDEDRERAWTSQKEAGKLDAHTLCLVKSPVLDSVPADCLIWPKRKSTRHVDSF